MFLMKCDILSFFNRNQQIEHDLADNLKLPKARKTGTTIVGLIYKDGVVLGADTRATEVGGKTLYCKSSFCSEDIRILFFFPFHIFIYLVNHF